MTTLAVSKLPWAATTCSVQLTSGSVHAVHILCTKRMHMLESHAVLLLLARSTFSVGSPAAESSESMFCV